MPRTILYNAVPIAVLLLALALVIAFHALPGHSAGLSVQVAPVRCDCFPLDRRIVLHVSNKRLLINSDPIEQRNLASRLSDIYSARLYRDLYLLVEDDVPFQQAAEVIDIVQHSKNLNIHLIVVDARRYESTLSRELLQLDEDKLAWSLLSGSRSPVIKAQHLRPSGYWLAFLSILLATFTPLRPLT